MVPFFRESHLNSDSSRFTKNPGAFCFFQLNFSCISHGAVTSVTSAPPLTCRQTKGVRFHWRKVMNIFIYAAKLGHSKRAGACVRPHVYSWLCVVMTWSVVFLSSWPMKLQEKVCGFGYASMSTLRVRLSPERTWMVLLFVGVKLMNPFSGK